MKNKLCQLTPKDIEKVFTKWETERRKNPDDFTDLDKDYDTPKDYGKAAARSFMEYL